MSRRPTVHRGETRGPHATSDRERHQLAAQRGLATRLRREALYDTHRKEVVDAGWAKVKGRREETRQLWFEMLEAKDRTLARIYQLLLLGALKIEEPYGMDWRDDAWAWGWY